MEVDCAYDGEEAIALAKQTEYDIVLLDVMLPKYDGFEVCQAIREFSDMPIIICTVSKPFRGMAFWTRGSCASKVMMLSTPMRTSSFKPRAQSRDSRPERLCWRLS